MSPHKQVYLDTFHLTEGDFIADYIDGSPAVDIHLIEPEGRGGNESLIRIENAIPLSRGNHNFYGGKKQYKAMLYKLVLVKLIMLDIDFDAEWLFSQIKKHES